MSTSTSTLRSGGTAGADTHDSEGAITIGATLQYGSYPLELSNRTLNPNTTTVAARSASATISQRGRVENQEATASATAVATAYTPTIQANAAVRDMVGGDMKRAYHAAGRE